MHKLDFAEEARLTIVMQEYIINLLLLLYKLGIHSRLPHSTEGKKQLFSAALLLIIALKWESRGIFYNTLQLPSLLQTSLPRSTAFPRERWMNYEGKRWKESEPVS